MSLKSFVLFFLYINLKFKQNAEYIPRPTVWISIFLLNRRLMWHWQLNIVSIGDIFGTEIFYFSKWLICLSATRLSGDDCTRILPGNCFIFQFVCLSLKLYFCSRSFNVLWIHETGGIKYLMRNPKRIILKNRKPVSCLLTHWGLSLKFKLKS